MRGHTIRFCTKEGGGLAKASNEWKKEYFRLVREYGRSKKGQKALKGPASLSNPRRESAVTRVYV